MGMTLRDYFAAQALEGDFAAQSSETGEWLDNTPDDFLEKRAQLYYRMADAMVKARDTI
jgi:hypothetical protein